MFGFIKYGTTAYSFHDFVTANCQFRISANRGRKGDGILLTVRWAFPAVSLYLRNPCTGMYVSVVFYIVQLQERRGVQRTLPLVGVIHKRATTRPLVRRPRRTKSQSALADIQQAAVRAGQRPVCTRRRRTVRHPRRTRDTSCLDQSVPTDIPSIRFRMFRTSAAIFRLSRRRWIFDSR